MGTDIHGAMLRRWKSDRKPGAWELVSTVPRGRNYALFAALAGVRNGYGFAGCEIFKPLVPIAEGRELHPDIPGSLIENVFDEEGEKNFGKLDVGDHSRTWMTLEELVEWPGWNESLEQSGVLSKEEYYAWKDSGNSAPDSWCGDCWGQGIVKTTEDELLSDNAEEGWTHIRCKFSQPMREVCKTFLVWLDWIRAESDYDFYKEHGKSGCYDYILCVGFDS